MQKSILLLTSLLFFNTSYSVSPNQTQDLSPIYPGDELPFKVSIEEAHFSLPVGWHSGAKGSYKGKWVLIAGRTNGLHGFNNTGDFPPSAQNRTIYVVDPFNGIVYSRDLTDPQSGLTEAQIDLLSATSPEFYQRHNTLYMAGGYGIDSINATFSTKPYLTAINLPGIIHWVVNPSPDETAQEHIRQLFNPIFQVTGGTMLRGEKNLTLLVFGQNFTGEYSPSANGNYTNQVRRFEIIDNGKDLSVKIKKSDPLITNPNFRRRDLNIIPLIRNLGGESLPAFVALSGVFTEAGGIWTVPVIINVDGKTEMDDPMDPFSFKQGMNNYAAPTLSLYSGHFGAMYMVIFGGISYGYFDVNGFQTDEEIPFINQITTIKYDEKAKFKQYLMSGEYPVIPSTFSNPGNPLLFGAGASFFPRTDLSTYDNGVIKFDKLNKNSTLVGYIVGGITSTLPNTNTAADSFGSPYIFRVILQKNDSF